MTIDPTLQRLLATIPGTAARQALAADTCDGDADGCDCGPGCECTAGSCGCGS